MQPRRLLISFAMRVHCHLMVNLSTRTPRSFYAELLSSWSARQHVLVHGAVPPQGQLQDFVLPLIELHEVHVQLISPAFWGPSGWQHTHLVYQPLLSVCHTITESQNHRIVGVGRDLCGSCSPTLLPKQGHLQEAAQDLVQAALEYLLRRRLHHLPGQPVPVLRHPQSEEVLPRVQMELLTLHLVPTDPCPVLSLYIYI